MRYNININNKKAKEWNLNVQQAYLFVFFYELPSWAKSITYDNETYYFASKNKAIEEMPLLTEKRDTMYRYYKQLEEMELIKLVKVEGKDYAKLTSKGKQWNWESDTSDKNPNNLGKLSETPSDKNPTYNNTISYNNTIYNKPEKSDFEGLENKTNQYLSNELNISKKQFLYLWNLARIKILGAKHSNYNTIPAYNISALETIAKNYCIGDIKKAIQGLFKQDCIPKMKSSPKHFLDVDNFETYLDAYNNKLSNLYDKPKHYKEQQL